MDPSVRGFEVVNCHIYGFVRLDPPHIRDVVQKPAESLPKSCRGQYRFIDAVVDAAATGPFRIE